MKQAILMSLGMCLALFAATSQAVIIHQNPDGGVTGAWNWPGNAATNHTVAIVDIGDGNMVTRHTSAINSTGGTTGRFGSKWDITVSGNTSADPADYTISFKLRNVSGNWNPIPFDLAVLTKEEGGDYGRTFPQTSVSQSAGWVDVKFKLSEATGNWWQGTAWNLTNTRWSLEVGMPGLAVAAGSSWTQVWEMDDLKILLGSEEVPHDPVPADGEPLAGEEIDLNEANVTLGWMAGGDPDFVTAYPVDPAILGFYVNLSNGIAGDEPNMYLMDYVPQVHNADPNLTDPYNEYGPIALKRGVTYYWQIEQAYENPNNPGTPYVSGDPNNMLGPVWSFTVVPPTAGVSAAAPAYNVVDAGNDLIVSVTGTAADTYQWYKIGDPDVALADGADYAGVNTDTLTIYDVQVADEGYYYCVVENALPSTASNRDTGPARVMTKRLMNHYAMESMAYDVNPNGITPDAVSGFDMRMASNDTGTDVPVLEANTVPGLAGTSSLKFDNPRANPADPNNVDAQYAQIDEGMLVAYQDITISAWVYNSGGSNWNRIVDFGNNNANYVFLCLNPGSVNNAVRFAVNVSGTEQSVTSAAGAVPVGEWTFISATLSGNTARLYVNGERVAINTSLTNNPISFAPTTQNWLARSQWGAGDGYFNGMVDDLKIWNYGLSAQEVGFEYLMTVTDQPWVCDREAWQADALMVALDVNDDCQIDMVDLASFAGKWLEDAYQISLP